MTQSNQDEIIEMRVGDALRRTHDLEGGAIDVTVSAGLVTLRGAVDDEEARAKAATIAATQSDVRGVSNLLTLKPDWGEEGQALSEFKSDADADAETNPGFKTRDAL